MLDIARRSHVFHALDYDLGASGPDFLIGATAASLAKDIHDFDPTLPARIESAVEMEEDVQAWLDRHARRAIPDPESERLHAELWEDICAAEED